MYTLIIEWCVQTHIYMSTYWIIWGLFHNLWDLLELASQPEKSEISLYNENIKYFNAYIPLKYKYIIYTVWNSWKSMNCFHILPHYHIQDGCSSTWYLKRNKSLPFHQRGNPKSHFLKQDLIPIIISS